MMRKIFEKNFLLILGLVLEHEVAYDEAVRLCVSPFVAIVAFDSTSRACASTISCLGSLGLLLRQTAMVLAFEQQVRWRSVCR
jgi:hypothetical protein